MHLFHERNVDPEFVHGHSDGYPLHVGGHHQLVPEVTPTSVVTGTGKKK